MKDTFRKIIDAIMVPFIFGIGCGTLVSAGENVGHSWPFTTMYWVYLIAGVLIIKFSLSLEKHLQNKE